MRRTSVLTWALAHPGNPGHIKGLAMRRTGFRVLGRSAWAILSWLSAGLCLVQMPACTQLAALAIDTCAGSFDRLHFSPDTLPDGQVGQAYAVVINLSNQHTPAFIMGTSKEELPPGLKGTFDQEKQTYTINGTPTQSGKFTLTVDAVCYGTMADGQQGQREYRLVIK